MAGAAITKIMVPDSCLEPAREVLRVGSVFNDAACLFWLIQVYEELMKRRIGNNI